MNNINNKINWASKSLLSFFRGDSAKSSGNKVKAAMFAIAIGMLIGIIPILATGGDFFKTYTHLFIDPFKKFSIRKTFTMISIFALLGTGIGISFKTGLFNIGAAGQFLMAGSVTVIFGILFNWEKYLSIPVLIIISALVGAISAGICGILKAFFNVHEVVSTILFNSILFYIAKYIFKMDKFKGKSSEASTFVHDSMAFNLSIKSNDVWLVVGISVSIILMVWIIFKYTTFGFKMKVNGFNSNSAKYSGMNVKMITIYSMAFSGALAGIAGFIYYNSYQGQMPALGNNLPSWGFEAITVTLLAFSSPLGAILSGSFYGIVKAGMSSAAPAGGIPKETIDLVLGIIILFSSIAPLLIKIKPIDYFKKYMFSIKNENSIVAKRTKHLNISKIKKRKSVIINKINSKYKDDKLKIIKFKKLNQNFKQEDLYNFALENKILFEIKKIVVEKWSQEIQDIKRKQKNKETSLIDRDSKILEINNKYKQISKEFNFNELKDIKSRTKIEIKNEKTSYKQKLLDELNKAKLNKEAKGVQNV